MNQSRGGYNNQRGGGRGGGRGGARGGYNNNNNNRGDSNNNNNANAQAPKETPDHSPIGDIEGLIARLGDIYLTLDDPTQVNLYNNYNHQFDIYLPDHSVLEPFYNEPTPLHIQIRKIGDEIKQLIQTSAMGNKSTKMDQVIIERVVRTLFRALTAFPTKVSIYASFVAHLGIDQPHFLTMILNETYKQLEASIKGLLMVMLLDVRKDNLNVHGTGRSRSLLNLLSTLTLSTTPTTTISTPAIHYEALMRFLATLVGYGCVAYTTWTTILLSLRGLCSLSFNSPADGNWDKIASVQYDPLKGFNRDAEVKLNLFVPDALPFELASVQSVIEKLTQNSTAATSTVMDESVLSNNNVNNDEDNNPAPSQHQSSSQHRTNKVLPGKSIVLFTAFTDVIVHGMLSALTFASRDLLNFGSQYNSSQHNNITQLSSLISSNPQTVINSDSILFNLSTNWYNNLESRSPEDVDVELDYDFQSQTNTVLLPGINTTDLQQVTIDKITFQATAPEYFYIVMLKSISNYLFFRGEAFGQQIKQDNIEPNTINGLTNTKSPTLFNSSTYLTNSANTWKFFSQPEAFQDDKVSAFAQQNTSQSIQNTSQNDHYFDYLSWAYFSLTGSLPDGAVHIIRSLQDSTSPHSWGLITRPFSLPTPSSRSFKQQVRSHYINLAHDTAQGLLTTKPTAKQVDTYIFNAPKLQDKPALYIVPSVDNATTQINSMGLNASKIAKKRAGTTISKPLPDSSSTSSDNNKMSNKLIDYLSPTQQDMVNSYTKNGTELVQFFVTQPAAFPPILPLLPQRPQAASPSDQPKDALTNLNNPSQAKYSMVPNANNVDVWLTYSYLFYSNLTYHGLQEEYNSLLSSLPPLFPIWGYSQSPLYLTDGAAYRKYAKCYASVSRQAAVTQSTVSTIVGFFFAMIMSNTNNFIEPLTPVESGGAEGSPFIHNNLTSNYKSHFIFSLIRFMYEHPTKVPASLGPRFFQLFKLSHYLSLTSRHNLAIWFAEHLCQFNFMFPWNHFAFLNALNDPTHVQYGFMSAVLSRCVKLTSFSVVAANVRQLWLLLPTIRPLLNQLKPQSYNSTTNSTLVDGVALLPAADNHPHGAPLTDIEQKILVAPTITTNPLLNEPLLVLSKALSHHVHKLIVLTTLYFAPGVFNSQLISQFQQLLYTLQPLEIAQQYVVDPENSLPDPSNLAFLSVQQAATWAVDPSRINIFACYFWVSLLTAAKATNTHFQYYLTNYGDVLTVLCNTHHQDLLHTGFHDLTNIGEQDSNTPNNNDQPNPTWSVPGYNPYSKEYETIDPSQYPQLIQNVIVNSNYISTQNVPKFPPSMLYHNGFILCPLLDQNNEIVTPSRTVITALPNPTQLVLLDLLLLFYNNELSHISTKLQFLLQFNVISIPTVLVWLLFYLPRHQHVKSTVFNPMLIELLNLVIDLYLMSNNERESKFLDLFKSTFATISTITTTTPSQDTTTTMDENNNTESSMVTTTQDDITPALLDKVAKIKAQQDKITNYKVNFFSTIFSFIYDWIADWPTVLIVLKTQAYARSEAFHVQQDEGDDDENSEERRLKRQRNDNNNNNVDEQFDNATLIYQDDDCIVKHVASVIIALLTRYKVDIRNISKDIVDQCNIPGLEAMIKQVFQ